MSVSHVTPSFLHSHRHLHHRQRAERRPRTEAEARHRTNRILLAIGLVLFGVLVTGFVGLFVSTAPTSPNASYGDGSAFISPPPIATMWLAVILMDVVALIALGIFSAAQNQQ